MKKINPDLPSAHYFLSAGDVEKFRTGRAKLDILKDINWKGNFQMAGRYQHGSACAIAYQLFSQDPVSQGGEGVFAIFVDDKFVKFVKWFPTVNTMSIKIGNVNWLVSAVEKEAVNIADLEKEFKARPPVPDQVDVGLTTAYLLLRALGKVPGPEGVANYEKNAKLRDKFNAARLKIGMSELEVNAVFKAKPLITGQVEAGTVNVYGSNESIAVSILIPYSNILVLFNDGKVFSCFWPRARICSSVHCTCCGRHKPTTAKRYRCRCRFEPSDSSAL